MRLSDMADEVHMRPWDEIPFDEKRDLRTSYPEVLQAMGASGLGDDQVTDIVVGIILSEVVEIEKALDDMYDFFSNLEVRKKV